MQYNNKFANISHSQNKEGDRMTDKLITIEKQIHRLKERRNKLYAQQAVLFYKEVEKIFKNGFCPILALDILTKTCETASALQQQEWKKRVPSFRIESTNSNCKNPQAAEPTDLQSRRAKIQKNA